MNSPWLERSQWVAQLTAGAFVKAVSAFQVCPALRGSPMYELSHPMRDSWSIQAIFAIVLSKAEPHRAIEAGQEFSASNRPLGAWLDEAKVYHCPCTSPITDLSRSVVFYKCRLGYPISSNQTFLLRNTFPIMMSFQFPCVFEERSRARPRKGDQLTAAAQMVWASNRHHAAELRAYDVPEESNSIRQRTRVSPTAIEAFELMTIKDPRRLAGRVSAASVLTGEYCRSVTPDVAILVRHNYQRPTKTVAQLVMRRNHSSALAAILKVD
ncbi:hypothetical protein CALVIDRAFT_555900 [Calocera viscosa TUFC12733]|uniref:Uncharacterized protein n=1 Tax=Calocera viscosa (strain TUFC12733) TaxID=1330018 RepID=A0A167L0R9_CALVF|nr:hypothetical protein CALVIDRAFT_555900 [Calocera viscosa TUFC12733]